MKVRRLLPTLTLAGSISGLGILACHMPSSWGTAATALSRSLLAPAAAHADESLVVAEPAGAAAIQNPFVDAPASEPVPPTVDAAPVALRAREEVGGPPGLEPIRPHRTNPAQPDDGETSALDQPPAVATPMSPRPLPAGAVNSKPRKMPVKDRYADRKMPEPPMLEHTPSDVLPVGHAEPIVMVAPTPKQAPSSVTDPVDGEPVQASGHELSTEFAPAPEPVAEVTTSESEEGPSHGANVTLHWTTPSTVALGQEVAAQLVVRNVGPGAARGVRVDVQLPAGVEADTAEPAPTVEGHALVWRLGDLSPGASTTIQLGFTPRDQGELSPRASVTFTQHAAASIRIVQPKLAMAIEGPQQSIAGQPTTYQIRVSNKGTGPAVGVSVDVQLAEGLSAASGAKPRYNVGTLGAGESRMVQITVFGPRPGDFAVRCQAVVDERAMDEVSHIVHIVQPSLAVEMEGPKLRFVDRKATYMIKVQNPGPAPIENVQLLEQIPEGFRFVEASSGGSFDRNARQVAWFVGRLEANETATVGVQLIASEAGDHRLSAAAKADYGVIGEAETVTKVKGAPHVTIDVTEDDDPVEVDGETVYRIRLSNQGSTPAQRVQFAAEVPKQMQIIDVGGPAEGAIKGQQVVFPAVNVLDAGQSVTYDVHVKCREAGQVRFRAFFRSQDTPSAVLEEETTRIYGD